jgi:hypothetical protein
MRRRFQKVPHLFFPPDQYAMRLNRQVQANRMKLIEKMKGRAFIEKMKALKKPPFWGVGF